MKKVTVGYSLESAVSTSGNHLISSCTGCVVCLKRSSRINIIDAEEISLILIYFQSSDVFTDFIIFNGILL
uniref:Bm564 n=1 Tax=Brugia malayi TaxID=6279 RepID=A0A0H5S871_BRUMA|nr:Bm564 [Brugia malayi]